LLAFGVLVRCGSVSVAAWGRSGEVVVVMGSLG
jgi:hypothetical protein